jgi:transcriptional regulator with XRE-family HTH domain
MLYSLGQRIQKARDTRGYTQKYMALEINVSASTWSQYESDKREPSLTHFKQIARKLEVSADWLLGFTDDEPNLKEDLH